MSRRGRVAILVAMAIALAGCTPSPGPSGPARRATLTVFAAASLKGVLPELGTRFEAAHAGVRVTFSFAGSSALAEQLIEGAPADVFAPADEPSLAKVATAGLIAGQPVLYASNRLTIVVPPGNPAGVRNLADLAGPEVRLVACAPAVPCGSAVARIEAATGTVLSPVSEEQAVTDVLGKVQAGEADAGLVYVTDARSAGASVEEIGFAESATAVNRNPIAVLAGSAQPALGRAFLELVTGPEGRRVLRAAGFGEP